MTITTVLVKPNRATMTETEYSAAADAWADALPTWTDEANATAAAMNLTATNDTSSTSNAIGTGAKTFTVTAGKSFQPGMYLVFADAAAPSTNSMFCQVTSYSGTSLVVSCLSVRGSGTKSSWVISQSANGVDGTAASAGLGSNTFTGVQNGALGASIASAATIDLTTATGNTAHVTGTTGIGAVTLGAGMWRMVIFDGVLTLTHNATTNNIGGSNITTAAGDRCLYFSDGSTVWGQYFKTGGDTIKLGTLTSASGASVDFTGIPSWTRRVTINFFGISTNGTNPLLVQMGDAGGVETSGYLGASSALPNAAAIAAANSTAGFILQSVAAANVIHGKLVLDLLDPATNTWAASGVFALSNAATSIVVAGTKATSAGLDRVRITTTTGVDTFDAGSLNIAFE